VTCFGFFIFAGLLAAAMRWQLAWPENDAVGPDLYNQLFTTHGTTMMFLFAVPIFQGLGVYLVPLMVGAREIAFPRLNAFSYWLLLFGGLLLISAFLLNIGTDVGWFAYVPLSGPQYSPGKRADFWAQMITFSEVSALAVAVQLIVTIFKMRAPGMSINRIPLFVWAQLVASFMVIFAMPAVMLASSALISDRLVATHFFNPAEGGDVLLRSAGARHVFCGRTPALRSHRRVGFSAVCRILLLVPENHRANAERHGREVELLAVFHRLQHDFFPDALARPRRDASARLYLSRRARLERDEPAGERRCGVHRSQRSRVPRQC